MVDMTSPTWIKDLAETIETVSSADPWQKSLRQILGDAYPHVLDVNPLPEQTNEGATQSGSSTKVLTIEGNSGVSVSAVLQSSSVNRIRVFLEAGSTLLRNSIKRYVRSGVLSLSAPNPCRSLSMKNPADYSYRLAVPCAVGLACADDPSKSNVVRMTSDSRTSKSGVNPSRVIAAKEQMLSSSDHLRCGAISP